MTNAWKQVPLTDLYDVSSGLSKPAKDFGSGHPFLSFKDVFWNFFVPEELDQLVQSTDKERISCSVKKGDVFLTRTSEKIEELGMSCVALKDYENASFNGFSKRLRPKADAELEPKFVGFYLRSPQFRAEITAYSSLTTRASLNNDIIGRLKIPTPTLHTQRKIARILSAYDDLIENNLKRIKLLEEKARLTYEEWFVRLKFPGHETAVIDAATGLPEGWETGIIGNLCRVKGGKRIPAGHQVTEAKTEHPYIRVKDIDNGTIALDSLVFIDNPTHLKIKRYIISDTDIFISIAGTIGLVGIIPKILSGANLTENCAKLTEFKLPLLQEYLFLYLNSEKGQHEIAARAGGASQPKLALYKIAQIPVLIPSSEILDDFNDFVFSIRYSIENLACQNQLLKEARDILLPRLMTGVVDVDNLKI